MVISYNGNSSRTCTKISDMVLQTGYDADEKLNLLCVI